MDINKFEIKKRKYYYKGIVLKITTNSQGYNYVRIDNKNKRLHRLIALKYINNPNKLKLVGHRDGVKSNNDIKNLYWTTYSENIISAIKSNPNMLRMHQGERKVIAKKTNLTIKFKSVRQASRILKRDVAAIVRCCQGEWEECNGFKLSYAE